MAHYVQIVEKCRGHVSEAELAALAARYPDPLTPEVRTAAEVKADELFNNYAGAAPFSFQQAMDDIERSLAKGPLSGLEPNSPELWKGVVVVLYERQWRAFDMAISRGQVETPWDAFDSVDFEFEVEAALALPEDDPTRISIEMEIERRAVAQAEWQAAYEARHVAARAANVPALHLAWDRDSEHAAD